ncbi:endonuclease/exonuclease/phosphatase family protein [Kitasatospora herbaricolor]|uniref:Endonuclease/exonuclease/phosphatase family protein n=1 Tax=Kitasatospora herbaricolor TaxID=68217 RepID=A0ABZ1W0P0_9ACTN|nr:endonuclease/exonuclease/phosphatase family protein [Kitasatospora herbaricolor]
MSAIIGTWNLENFCRPLPAGSPPNPNKCAAKDQATYDAKVEALAGVITEIAPDLLGVQEVGSQEALDDLVAKLPGTWHTALSDHPDPRGIRVGVISRWPLTNIQQRTAFPAHLKAVQVEDENIPNSETGEMGRGALAVTVEPTPGHTLVVAVCHLKSKLLTFPGNQHATHDEGLRARYAAYALFRRGAEAVTMRDLADQLLQGDGTNRDVIVLGDLNDGWQAATTQILYGPPGSQMGTGGFEHPDQGDAKRLWNLAPKILEQGGFSRIFEGQHELIDHILISHALLAKFQEVSTGLDKLPTVTEAHPAAPHDKPSDHSPVVAKFNL